jgi:hypothetical protein
VAAAAKSALSSLSPGRSPPLSFPVTSEELLKHISALGQDEDPMKLANAMLSRVHEREDQIRAGNQV